MPGDMEVDRLRDDMEILRLQVEDLYARLGEADDSVVAEDDDLGDGDGHDGTTDFYIYGKTVQSFSKAEFDYAKVDFSTGTATGMVAATDPWPDPMPPQEEWYDLSRQRDDVHIPLH